MYGFFKLIIIPTFLTLIVAGCSVNESSSIGKQLPETAADISSDKEVSSPGIVVAVIGGENIKKEELDRAYGDYLASNESVPDSETTRKKFQEDFIQKKLVVQYALNNKLDKDGHFKKQMQRMKEDLLFETGRSMLLSGVYVSEQEAEEYYRNHIDEFTEPGKIQVRHILTNTKEDAEKALERLQNEESFDSVAKEVSVHSSARDGGELPAFSKGTYNKAFEDIAFNLPVGEISEVVKTELGYHIIQKTGETPTRVIPLESASNSIIDTLFEKKQEEHWQNVLTGLAEQYQVEVYENW